MKKCPFCAEEIQEEAIKCKHCGEWLHKTSNAPMDENSGGHNLKYIIGEVTSEKVTAKPSTENNSQRNNVANPEVSNDCVDQTISTRLELLDMVEKSFRRFKILCLLICFFPSVFGVVVASINPSKPFLDIIFLLGGLVIIITACLILYHLWFCARLIGSNPLLYVLMSVIMPIIIGAIIPASSASTIPAYFTLPIVGIIIAYNILKKAAVKQGLVKFSMNKRWWQF
jgi:hypothetical protein